jgi:hypothetical protein
MVFRTNDPATKAAARLSPVGRDPSEAGRRSWAKRSAEERERRTKILLASANPQASGQAHAELCRDPKYRAEFLVWLEVGRELARAKREGHLEPKIIRRRIVEEPYTGPEFPSGLVKRPGSAQRRKQRKLEREAAAKAEAEKAKANGSADTTPPTDSHERE